MAFNETVMDHVLNPRNAGPLHDATCIGCVGIPGEGRYIKLFLAVAEDRIEKASYECNGCPASIACASLVCQLARGRTTDFAGLIEPNDVLVLLGGLPEGKGEMAHMAVEALRLAIGAPLKGNETISTDIPPSQGLEQNGSKENKQEE